MSVSDRADSDAELARSAPMTSAEVLASLLRVRTAAVAAEEARADVMARLPGEARTSAANLAHYLALRRFDLRREQHQLSRLGLSSLGRAEAHVLATLDAVIERLAADVPELAWPVQLRASGPDADTGDDLLAAHTEEAFGPPPPGHVTRVMVTLPSEAATDTDLVEELVDAGMAVARVNTAHDDPDAWRSMIGNVRAAAARRGRDVRVMCDLPGPKLRIGPLEPGPDVVRARPRRDDYGRLLAPARVRLVSQGASMTDVGVADAVVVPVDRALVEHARPGDLVLLRDSRDRSRRLHVEAVYPWGVEATVDRTVYIRSGLRLRLRRGHKRIADGLVGAIDRRPGSISLSRGDALELRLGDGPGRPAVCIGEVVTAPAMVTIGLAAVLDAVRPGHRVLFDDGALAGVVVDVGAGRATVEITSPGTGRLRADKGVNVPDSDLAIGALTDDDLAILEVVAPLADLVALSFVDDPRDVERLHRELDRLGAPDVGVVLKIERRTAFEALPELLFAALARRPVAVMVARGDLAVEVGFLRLAELQEEILWFCEAAHVPVIWATQVLESLAKRGAPTRAEVTDASWAVRAECVMLNKGPHIPEAMAFLDDISMRMRGLRDKRTPMMRPLSIAVAASPDHEGGPP